MRFGPLFVVVLAVLFSAGAALGGYLQGEVVSTGSDGTTFRLSWSQGVTTDYSVKNKLGETVSEVSPLVVNEGPNSCNSDGLPGNARAYFASISSDDTEPQYPDGYVDCENCDCEPAPGTNFLCRSLDGECIQCDACTDAGGNAACGSRSDGETDCEHVTCSSYDCVCDTTDCDDRTNYPSCSSSVYDDECDESERVPYTQYSCSGDSCTGSSADRLCTRDTDGDSCDGGDGTCDNGGCVPDCPEPTQCGLLSQELNSCYDGGCTDCDCEGYTLSNGCPENRIVCND